MLKNMLSAIAKSNSRRISETANRKIWIYETTLAENRSKSFNPKKARYKSVKGISILNKEI